ncbi:virion structural protein [Acaryochloris phage A-HIS1]|nr:virion structural protein [Acaryochloris phage A-HIS1]
MADRSIIIDPGGVATLREGINLQTFPIEYEEMTLDVSLERTANAQLVSSAFAERFEIEWKALVTQEEFRNLRTLISWNTAQRSENRTFETVIYNLFEPFAETVPARTRFIVPSTPIIEQVGPDSVGNTKFVYWIALQGNLNIEYERFGSCQEVTFTFSEGTFLSSSLEA